ncbi:FAD binding domain-containing protein [Xylariomycetidae sp. FL2044]|nr:FAD binding domain-containing protein [Xylariomycetidae sp. FL2044]
MTSGADIYEVDVLVVGSGAAGLTAALTAQSSGLRTLLVEKGPKIGGTSAYSGGAVWIPNNPIAKAHGIHDSLELAHEYMDAAIGDAGPESSPERRSAYLENGPKMVSFLRDLGFQWFFAGKRVSYPDYYPDLPGALPQGGRSLEPAVFPSAKLGPWQQHLVRPERNMPAIHNHETPVLTRALASVPDFLRTLWILARVRARAWLGGGDPVSMGRSLVAQLLHLNIQHATEIWRETSLVSLTTDPRDGSVTGAILIKPNDSKQIQIRAHAGVILCTAGFARNASMRAEHHHPHGLLSTPSWSLTHLDGDTGAAIQAAATALMDDAWWIPTLADPVDGRPNFAVFEMSRPFAIVVDSSGARFLAEALPYADAGHAQWERHRSGGADTGAGTVTAVPAWLVFDAEHRRRYALGTLPPRRAIPAAALRDGRVVRAGTLDALAEAMGVDAAGLTHTVTRWNEMCANGGGGVDADFGKGGDAYQRYLGDPGVRPNPNMGPLRKPPFYATRVYPGDIGTKGGLLTDGRGRVVRGVRGGGGGGAEEGQGMEGKGGYSHIPGLYAAGNCTASVMGKKYCGAGATIGPAMTWGFVAARDLVEGMGEVKGEEK